MCAGREPTQLDVCGILATLESLRAAGSLGAGIPGSAQAPNLVQAAYTLCGATSNVQSPERTGSVIPA